MNTAVSDSLWKHRRWSRRDVFFLIDNMKCWDALFKRQSEVVSWSFKREVSVRFPNFQSVNPQCDSNGISTSQIITTVFYLNLKNWHGCDSDLRWLFWDDYWTWSRRLISLLWVLLCFFALFAGAAICKACHGPVNLSFQCGLVQIYFWMLIFSVEFIKLHDVVCWWNIRVQIMKDGQGL